LYENDKLFVFTNPSILAKAIESIEAVDFASLDNNDAEEHVLAEDFGSPSEK
jgi:hypothetical protein